MVALRICTCPVSIDHSLLSLSRTPPTDVLCLIEQFSMFPENTSPVIQAAGDYHTTKSILSEYIFKIVTDFELSDYDLTDASLCVVLYDWGEFVSVSNYSKERLQRP